MKRLVGIILGLAMLAGGVYWLHSSGRLASYLPTARTTPVAANAAKPAQAKRPASPVETAVAKSEELSDDISAIGSLLSDESVDIAAETNGRIVEILFADGAEIEEGAVLFRLDQKLVLAQVADAKARLDLAKSVVERNSTLIKSKNIAQSIFDQSNTELTLAESALALAEVQLGKLTIRAPFSGRVGFRSVSVGAYVQAGASLVHVEKIDKLKAAFSVPELFFQQLQPGQRVNVTADAVANENFEATISAISPLVDINGRALQVRAELDNTANRLRPGMLIRIAVRGPQRNAVTVPEAAIVPRSNGVAVFTVTDAKAKEVKVTMGKRTDGVVEILDGIKVGDEVIVAGNARLADGATVVAAKPLSN